MNMIYDIWYDYDYDGLLIVFLLLLLFYAYICDGRSDSVTVSKDISIDRLLVYLIVILT